MSATEHGPGLARRLQGRRRRGVSFVAVAFFVVTAASFAVLAIGTTNSNYTATKSRLETQRAFYIAEGGIDLALAKLTNDNYWAARDATEFPTVEADGSYRSGWRTLGANAGRFQMHVTYVMPNALPAGWTGPGLPTGYNPFKPVVFANRVSAKPPFSRILVEVVGEHGASRKTVRANVKLEFKAYGAAIVADSQTIPGSGGGKSFSLSNDATVLDGQGQFIHGGIRSNGLICVDRSDTPVTQANAETHFPGFTGTVATDLYGTGDQIPDYTNPGSADQLFDFARFKAAATAGRGQVYTSLDAFVAGVNAANTAGKPLEGITYVVLDCDEEGGSPKLDDGDMPGGINIKGTLVFDFINPPDKFYKMFGECPLNINAAPIPANFDPKDPSTFTTGYPPVISAAKDPRGFDLTPYGFKSFDVDDDLPALMFQTGTVDLHEEVNICGAVYGPSFIEIEQKSNGIQYFNGIVIGGAGIYVAGANEEHPQVFAFDPTTVDALATSETIARIPSIKNFIIGE